MGTENSNATYVAYIDGKPVEMAHKPVQFTVAHIEDGEIVPDTQDFSAGWSSAADTPENVTAAAMAWKGATITMKATEANSKHSMMRRKKATQARLVYFRGQMPVKVGLIDVDSHRYPNLALMKISAWHKARGDTVEWWWSDLIHYDVVYMSKVFSDTYTPDHPEPLNADKVIKGGTGYAITLENGREVYHPERDKPLPPEIEHIFPDYSLYRELTEKTAYGFLTRGCPRGCGFCHVGGKEGRASRKVADLSEFWSGQRNINLMDPNILACPEHWDLLERLVASRAYVDFNQGLDIRLADKDVADLLGKMRIERLHFAWDNPKEDLRPYFERFTKWYRRKDPSKKGVYALTNFDSTLEEDLYTAICWKRILGSGWTMFC